MNPAAATTTPLSAGNAVALLSPSSWSESEWMSAAGAIVESWGLRVVYGRHARDRRGFLAGRDEDRLADLNDAIRDPEIRAVIALRAGIGSLRLMRGIDREALRRDPKPLVGFSDVTALHRVWHAAGVRSLHGGLGGVHREDVRAHLLAAAPTLTVVSDAEEITADLTTTGSAQGRLFGGNLEMLARSIGILPLDLTDHIVLLEINKAAGLGMVDRALCQLVLSGALDGIAGIALGRATGFEDHQDRGWTILDVLHEHLDRFEVPIVGGLPIGHGPDPWIVPLNLPCRLDTASRTLTIAPLYG